MCRPFAYNQKGISIYLLVDFFGLILSVATMYIDKNNSTTQTAVAKVNDVPSFKYYFQVTMGPISYIGTRLPEL